MGLIEIIGQPAAWLGAFLLLVLVYGFAPGFLLRLIVLMYESDNPRRQELVAELYVVPRKTRPFWVAEQLETALFDGLFPRLHWAMIGRLILRWRLGSGVKRNKENPQTFEIPSDADKALIEPGMLVKLMFDQSDGWTERMWVQVTHVGKFWLRGRLDNQPIGFPRLTAGDRIRFKRKHIIDIDVIDSYEVIDPDDDLEPGRNGER